MRWNQSANGSIIGCVPFGWNANMTMIGDTTTKHHKHFAVTTLLSPGDHGDEAQRFTSSQTLATSCLLASSPARFTPHIMIHAHRASNSYGGTLPTAPGRSPVTLRFLWFGPCLAAVGGGETQGSQAGLFFEISSTLIPFTVLFKYPPQKE